MLLLFRRATASDLPLIVAMLADDALGRHREAPDLPLHPNYLQAFAAIEADPNQFMVAAVIDEVAVGCLQLSFIPGLSRLGQWRGQIESVRVASQHRGEGIGRAMILWAIERCRERGCGLVQLTSDKSRPDAIRMYQSLGFQPSHEGLKLGL
jgi:ribosomal protein S18 acetylase RimI-like enzyme